MPASHNRFSNSHPRRRPRWRQAATGAALCALALLLIPTAATGQATGSVAGTVGSPGDAGISLAVARLDELSLSAPVAADGTFRFDSVPPGTYLLVVDIPSVGRTSQSITVEAGRETTVELEHDHVTHFDEIVVTASGDLRNESELPNAISVLGGADLQLRTGATLGETLAGEPGLSSSAFVPGAARPVIRGLSSARVRVLNGGMGTGDVSVESADHAITSDPLLADQIEVLRGPATLRYGSGAIGGAVNVVDGRIPANRAPKAFGGRIDLIGGSATGERTGALQLNGGGGEWAWHIGAVSRTADPYEIPGYARLEEEHDDHDDEGHEDEDHEDEDHEGEDHEDEDHDDHGDEGEHEEENSFGIVPNTDLKTESGRFGFTRFFGDRGFLGVSFSGFSTDYGIPPGAHSHAHHDHGGDDHDEDEHHDEDDHHDEEDDHHDEEDDHHDEEDDHHDEDEHGHGEDEHGHGEDEHEDEGEENIRLDMRQQRIDLRSSVQLLASAFERFDVQVSGTDYEHVEFESGHTGVLYTNELLETRVEMFQRERGASRGSVGVQYTNRDLAAIGAEAFIPPTHSDSWAAFTSQEIRKGSVRWQFGARFEQAEHDPATGPAWSGDGVSASAGMVWTAGEAWNLGLSASRSVRLPSPGELFSDGAHIPTRTFDIGDPDLDQEVGAGLDLTLRKDEGIVQGKLTFFRQDFQDFIYHAFTGAEMAGFPVVRYSQADATMTGAELHARIELAEWNGHDLHMEILGDTVDAELDEGGNLPRIPPMSLGAGLHYHGHDWRAAVEWRWVDDQNDVAQQETPTDGYTMLNAHVGRRFTLKNEIVDVLLRGRNLTDEEARVHTSLLKTFAPLPGRDVTLSLRYWF